MSFSYTCTGFIVSIQRKSFQARAVETRAKIEPGDHAVVVCFLFMGKPFLRRTKRDRFRFDFRYRYYYACDWYVMDARDWFNSNFP
jgi:hypothetical protein